MLRIAVAEENAPSLRPGDLILVPGRPGRWMVEESEHMPGLIRIVARAWDAPHGLSAVGAGSDHIGSDIPDVGETRLWAVDLSPLPLSPETGTALSLLAVGTGTGWPGAAVSMVQQDVHYPLGQIGPGLVAGRLTQPLAPASAMLFDRANSVTVELFNAAMGFESADAGTLALGGNLVHLNGEFLQFAEAEQLTPTSWRLSGLYRGLFGSQARAEAGHMTGAALQLLEPDMPRLDYAVGALETGLVLSFAAEGEEDDEPVLAAATVEKRGLVPFAPVHFAWHREAGTIRLRWSRRPRRYVAWQDFADMPPVESREAYRLVVTGAAQAISEHDGPGADIPVAEMQSLLGPAGSVALELRQLGDHAISPPAILTIPSTALS